MICPLTERTQVLSSTTLFMIVLWGSSLPPFPRFRLDIHSGRSIPIKKESLWVFETVFENQWDERLYDCRLNTSNEAEMYIQSVRTLGVQDIQSAVCRLCKDHLNEMLPSLTLSGMCHSKSLSTSEAHLGHVSPK